MSAVNLDTLHTLSQEDILACLSTSYPELALKA